MPPARLLHIGKRATVPITSGVERAIHASQRLTIDTPHVRKAAVENCLRPRMIARPWENHSSEECCDEERSDHLKILCDFFVKKQMDGVGKILILCYNSWIYPSFSLVFMSVIHAPEVEKEGLLDCKSFLLQLASKTEVIAEQDAKVAFLRSALRSLTRRQLAQLDENIRSHIELPAIFTRKKHTDVTESLDLKELVQQEVRSRLQTLSKEIWYNPTTWSDEKKEATKAGLWAGGIGLVIVGMAMFFRKASKKAAEVKDHVKQKTGWLWNKVKWMLGLGAAAGIGYTTYKISQGLKSVADIEGAIGSAQQRIDDLKQEAVKSSGAVQDAMNKEVRRLTEGIQALQKELKKKSAPATKDAMQANKDKVNNSIASLPRKEPAPPISSVATEATEEIVASGERRILAQVVWMQYRNKWDGGISDDVQLKHIDEAIGEHAEHHMGDTESWTITKGTQDFLNRQHALQALQLYCAESRESVLAYLCRTQNIAPEAAQERIIAMGLPEYLRYAAMGSQGLMQIMEHIKSAPRNKEGVINALKDAPFDEVFLHDFGMRTQADALVAAMSPENLGISAQAKSMVTWQDIVRAVLTIDGGTKTVVTTRNMLQNEQVSMQESRKKRQQQRQQQHQNIAHRREVEANERKMQSLKGTPEQQLQAKALEHAIVAKQKEEDSERKEDEDDEDLAEEAAWAPKAVILKLLNDLCSQDDKTHIFMLPLFHSVYPDAEREKETGEQRVRRYLHDNMSTSSAIRFLLYRKMLETGNVLSYPLMQLDVLRFIARSSADRSTKYRAVTAAGDSFVKQGVDETTTFWRQHGCTLNIHLTDNERKMIVMTGEALGSELVDGWKEMMFATYGVTSEWVQRNPVLAAKIVGGAGAVGIASAAMMRAGLHGNIWSADIGSSKKFWGTYAGMQSKTDLATRLQKIPGNLASKVSFGLLASTDDKIAVAYMHRKIVEAVAKTTAVSTCEKMLVDALSAPRDRHRWLNLGQALRKSGLSKDPEIREAIHFCRAIRRSTCFRSILAMEQIHFGFHLNTKWRQGFGILKQAAGTFGIAADRLSPHVVGIGKKGIDAIRRSEFLAEVASSCKVEAEALTRAIQAANIPTKLLDLFAKSKGGMYMLANALKTSGAAGLSYIAALGKFVPIGRLLSGPTGVVGLEAAFLAIEHATLNAEIAETSSPELKELYEQRKKIANGHAIIGTGMGLATLSGGVAAAAPLLPVWLTYMGVSATRQYYETATIEWMKDDKDMLRSGPATLLQNLESIKPGTQTNAEQNAARGGHGGNILSGSWLEQDFRASLTGRGLSKLGALQPYEVWERERFQAVEEVQKGQRAKVTRAYLSHMSDLPMNPGETIEDYKRRAATFLTKQEMYIDTVSKKVYYRMTSDVYEAAHAHAELSALCDRLKQAGASQFLPLLRMNAGGTIDVHGAFNLTDYNSLPPTGMNASGISRGNVIFSFQEQKIAASLIRQDVLRQVNTLDTTITPRFHIIEDALLTGIRHELTNLDRKLLEENLVTGWSDEKTRGVMRCGIRQHVLDLVRLESRSLGEDPTANINAVHRSLTKLRSYLRRDLGAFMPFGNDAKSQQAYEQLMSRDSDADQNLLLDWRNMREEISRSWPQQRAPRADTLTSTTSSNLGTAA